MRLGLAIGMDGIVAVAGRGRRPGPVHTRALGSGPVDGAWPELTEALGALLAQLKTARATASVALVPPLARAKVLALPRLGRRALRALVTRHTGRYFAGVTPPLVADAVRVGGARRGAPVPALTVCADRALVEAIVAAAAAAGVRCDALTAAQPALVEAVLALVPAARRGRVLIAVDGAGWCEGIAVAGGWPRALASWAWAQVAHLPAGAVQLARAAFARAADGPVPSWHVVPVGAAARQALDAAPDAAGSVPPSAALDALEPAALAAWGAARLPAAAPLLLPDALWARRQARQWRGMGAVAAAALILLLGGAGVHGWGIERELAAVAAARQTRAAAVERALALQGEVGAIGDRLQALAALGGRSPWTATVVALAQALPDSAYLVALAVDSGGVRVEGVAPSAAAAVRALQASRRLAGVRLVSAFRAERGEVGERFDLVVAGAAGPAGKGGR